MHYITHYNREKEREAYLIKSTWNCDIQPGLTQLTSVCSILGSYISNFLTKVDRLESVNTLNTHILWLLSYYCKKKKKKSVQGAVLQKRMHNYIHKFILHLSVFSNILTVLPYTCKTNLAEEIFEELPSSSIM